MPLPLAMMIPFMGIQSAVMAKQFGENFQYGKRRISAMSNDEFNKLTPKMIQDNANAELKAMIPSMQASITDMRQFQEFMIKEMIATIGDLLRNGLGFLLGVEGSAVNEALQNIEHFIHGHGGAHDNAPPPPTVQEPFPQGTPPQAPKPTTTPRLIDWNFLQKNATVKIEHITTLLAQMWIMLNGKWTLSHWGKKPLLELRDIARASYPQEFYNSYKLKNRLWWVLKSKI